MKVKGKRVLLNKPVIEKSPIEMTPEIQASIEMDAMKKWTKLVVYAVGEDVEGIKPGDKVYIPKGGLERSDILEVKGELKLMISQMDIAIVW